MTVMSPDASAPPPVEADLSRTYALVIAVEVLVILGLYVLGRYFS
jgi:hypothetical protein